MVTSQLPRRPVAAYCARSCRDEYRALAADGCTLRARRCLAGVSLRAFYVSFARAVLDACRAAARPAAARRDDSVHLPVRRVGHSRALRRMVVRLKVRALDSARLDSVAALSHLHDVSILLCADGRGAKTH